MCCAPAVVGATRPLAGGVYQAGLVTVRVAGSPGPSEVHEVVVPDGLAGDCLPPVLPLLMGAGWLVGGEHGVFAERAAAALPFEQAQRITVQRRFDPSPPCVQYLVRAGSSGDAVPLTVWCRTMFVQENLRRWATSPRPLTRLRSPTTHRSFLNLLNLPK
jgi:hypothetical protein